MSGAAALTARAALRSGAGYVVLAVPESLHDILEVKVTCALTRSLPEREGGLSFEALGDIKELASRADALAIGPGLGTGEETGALLRSWVPELLKCAVLDADALGLLGESLSALPRGRTVLTPHPGECGRLLGISSAAVQADRRGAALELASRSGGVVLLKGRNTLVVEAGEIWQNSTGNPGLATAGSGDVLSGVIVALLAAGLSPWDAARLGAHLHGRAGDLMAELWGQRGLTAADLPEGLALAMQEHDALDGAPTGQKPRSAVSSRVRRRQLGEGR